MLYLFLSYFCFVHVSNALCHVVPYIIPLSSCLNFYRSKVAKNRKGDRKRPKFRANHFSSTLLPPNPPQKKKKDTKLTLLGQIKFAADFEDIRSFDY